MLGRPHSSFDVVIRDGIGIATCETCGWSCECAKPSDAVRMTAGHAEEHNPDDRSTGALFVDQGPRGPRISG
jgi:hypothetical protein